MSEVRVSGGVWQLEMVETKKHQPAAVKSSGSENKRPQIERETKCAGLKE